MMPASTENTMAECQPQSSGSSSSGRQKEQQQSTIKVDWKDDQSAAPLEKTISCVSCRKRKLKCDRVKPKCGTCSRLKHECEYPERRRNLGYKRRNMKELEARLAQVETQLVVETSKGNATSQTTPVQNADQDWNNFKMDMNMDMGNIDMLEDPYDVPLSSFDYQPMPNVLQDGNFFSEELISLGLSEPLPPQEMMDDLHQVYFEKYHPTMPMIHKYRYLAALSLPSHIQPPVCLRYAMWTTAASISEKYAQYEEVFYDRARRYIQEAEMKGHGETFVTVHFAQTWGLIATYEAKKTFFTRAWMSTGRMTRLTQMLGLQRLDGEGQDTKRILPPAKDWIELEERRRVFWASFYGDRWASSGTGWPMTIVEDEIRTHLPSSEEAFENDIPEESGLLSEALTPGRRSNISPFAGVVLSACLFGHNSQHLHMTGPDERPNDLANGEFWKRHRRMDNVLSNTFMFLPDHLRLPGGLRDMNVVFLHMNIHTATICLHQAAVLTAEKNSISSSFIRQSRTRCFMAAMEIANIMRLVSHLDASNMNSWMGFCLYVAAGVFIQDNRSEDGSPQSITNLEFLVAAMRAIGHRHSITHHFTAQLEIDMESSGIKFPTRHMPNISMNGIIPSRAGKPISTDDLLLLSELSYRDGGKNVGLPELCSRMSNMAKGIPDAASGAESTASKAENPAGEGVYRLSTRHFCGVLPRKMPESESVVHLPPEGLRENHVHPSPPNWDPPASSALSGSSFKTQSRQQTQASSDASAFSLPNPPIPAEPNFGNSAGSPFDLDSLPSGNTPSSDASSSNTMQVPHRQSGPNKTQIPGYSTLQADPSSFVTASDWNLDATYNGDPLNMTRVQANAQLPEGTDAVPQFFGAGSWGDDLWQSSG